MLMSSGKADTKVQESFFQKVGLSEWEKGLWKEILGKIRENFREEGD